uniref:Uncharacterized protein n=1 Tax=Romanomermis culicivorax TaxID=13658 RepID=A0A915IPN4_ROMCU
MKDFNSIYSWDLLIPSVTVHAISNNQ